MTEAQQDPELQNQLQLSEKLREQLATTWQEKLDMTIRLQAERREKLRQCGIVLGNGGGGESPTLIGVAAPTEMPYMLNFRGSTSRSCLIFYLRDGDTLIGDPDGPGNTSTQLIVDRTFVMQGPGILKQHCILRVEQGDDEIKAFVVPLASAKLFLNQMPVTHQMPLFTGDLISFGNDLDYCFQNPKEETPFRRESPLQVPVMSDSSNSEHTPTTKTGHRPRRTDDDAASVPSGLSSVHQPNVYGKTSSNSGSSDTFDSPVASPRMGERPLMPLAGDDTALCRTEAMFFFERGNEPELLSALITQMHGYCLDFKLAPAYALFLMIRGAEQMYCDNELRLYMSSIAKLIKLRLTEAYEDQDLATVLFWLSNISELLAAIKADPSLVTKAGDIAVTLTNCAEESFTFFTEQVYQRLHQAVPSILRESSIITTSPVRSTSKEGLSNLQFVIDQLKTVHQLIGVCLLSKFVADQIFGFLFHQMGTVLFNDFIQRLDFFCWERALIVKFNLSRMADFASSHGLKMVMDMQFRHISQAVLLLQLNKTSLASLDFICDNCGKLNSMHIEHILRNYQASQDEMGVSAELISCVKARAMNEADVECLEDESSGFRVQLLRQYAPAAFHLTGASHMRTGLVSASIITVIATDCCVSRATCRRYGWSRAIWPACSGTWAKAGRCSTTSAPSTPHAPWTRHSGSAATYNSELLSIKDGWQ